MTETDRRMGWWPSGVGLRCCGILQHDRWPGSPDVSIISVASHLSKELQRQNLCQRDEGYASKIGDRLKTVELSGSSTPPRKMTTILIALCNKP